MVRGGQLGYNGRMSLKVKAVCRYDGTPFAGWQVQRGERTVQGEIERALEQVTGTSIRIAGAGRTDAGVHALGQVFSADLPDGTDLPDLTRSLRKMLAPEVGIGDLEPMPEDFHASFSSTGKRYAYVLFSGEAPDPFGARYAWHVPREIDRGRLLEMLGRITGERDFAGFCSSGSSAKTTIRTVYSAALREGPIVGPGDSQNYLRIEFHGGGFLYKMVRNITGTLVDIARGQTPPERLEELLQSPSPYHGFTAPAHGLFLTEVLY